MFETYRIPEDNLGTLYVRIAKLAQRARKLNLEPITVKETGEEDFTQVLRCRNYPHDLCLHGARPTGPSDPDFRTVRWVQVQVSGLAPVIAGWNFLATITHEEAGNTVRRFPGTEGLSIPESYRTAPAKCDHCHLIRDRKDTYLVYKDTDEGPFEVKEVGGNCLRDFLGHKDPHAVATFLEDLHALEAFLSVSDDDERIVHGAGTDYTDTAEFLGHVAAIIRTKGWRSKGTAYEFGGPSTAALAQENLYDTYHAKRRNGYNDRPPVEVTDADRELVEKTLEWVQTLGAKEQKSDYEHNLFVSASKKALGNRDLGIVASAINAYKRTQEKAQEAKVKATIQAESKWVGEVGKRQDFNLTVDRTYEIDGDYGVTTIVNFHDADGNKLVWFASGERDFQTGDAVKVKGTVKAHSTNKKFGGEETVLTSCTLLDIKRDSGTITGVPIS